MVRFEENKIIIELKSSFPCNEWLNLLTALTQLTQNVTVDNITDEYYNIGWLLSEMLPDVDTVDKMG